MQCHAVKGKCWGLGNFVAIGAILYKLQVVLILSRGLLCFLRGSVLKREEIVQ